MINVSQAKEYFQLGLINGFGIVKIPLSEFYSLFLYKKDGSYWMLKNSKNELREFSDIETVVKMIKSINPDQALITLNIK